MVMLQAQGPPTSLPTRHHLLAAESHGAPQPAPSKHELATQHEPSEGASCGYKKSLQMLTGSHCSPGVFGGV